jgi:hypothetical protein
MTDSLLVLVHNGSQNPENYQNGQVTISQNGTQQGAFVLQGFTLAEQEINFAPRTTLTSYHDFSNGAQFTKSLGGNQQAFEVKANASAQFPNFSQNDSIEFHIFGSIEERYIPILRRHPNVILHGAYSPETVPIAAKECNISLHVSICPETYSLTLSESWELGLVPIVSDIGALGERVSHGINGFKIPPNSADALIVMLRDLVSNPSRLSAINKQVLADLPIAFLPEHIRQLLLIYKSVINNHHLLPSSYLSHEEPPQKIQSNNRINIEWASFDQRSHSDKSRFRATYNYFINQFRAYLSK